MIIRVVLLVALLLCLVYAYARKSRSHLISGFMAGTAIVGAYIVLFPSHTNVVANLVGVGRGADLIIYCWIMISFIVAIDLRFRILEQQREITLLARRLALESARQSAEWPADPLPGDTAGARAEEPD
jgi:hypothetical protein